MRTRNLMIKVLIVFSIINVKIKAQSSKDAAPEHFSFSPLGPTEMVDKLTGDFSYNIPVLNIPGPNGGYPMSLNYKAGIAMSEDASWVGLGWSLSPGAINRTVNRTPDDIREFKVHNVFRAEGVEAPETYNTLNALLFGFNWENVDGVRHWYKESFWFHIYLSAKLDGMKESFVRMSLLRNRDIAIENFKNTLIYNSTGQLGGNIGFSFGANFNKKELSVFQNGNIVSDLNLFFYKKIVVETAWKAYNHNIKLFSGSLYPGSALSLSEPWGKQSYSRIMDIYTNQVSNSDNSISNTNLSFPAYDNYHVSANGLAGAMTPYIFKDGALLGSGIEDQDGGYHYYMVDPGNGNEIFSLDNSANSIDENLNRINFIFNGETNSSVKTTPGYSNLINGEIKSFAGTFVGGSNYVNFPLDGKHTNNKIAGGKYVKTITNSSGSIVGFEITDESGTTYHFKQPVYQFERNQRVNHNYNETRSTQKYAYAWLLTAVTGPDYVDKGDAGFTSKDEGYWVKFNYGKWTDAYIWRTPSSSDQKWERVSSEDNDILVEEWGRKELYYLNSIETATHKAYFIKEVREDGLGSDYNFDYAVEVGNIERKIEDYWNLGALQLTDNDMLSQNGYYQGGTVLNVEEFNIAQGTAEFIRKYHKEVEDGHISGEAHSFLSDNFIEPELSSIKASLNANVPERSSIFEVMTKKYTLEANLISDYADPLPGLTQKILSFNVASYNDYIHCEGKFKKGTLIQSAIGGKVDYSLNSGGGQKVLGLKKIILVKKRPNDPDLITAGSFDYNAHNIASSDKFQYLIKHTFVSKCGGQYEIPEYYSDGRKYYGENVIDIYDLAASNIENNALQIIEFESDYSLCSNAPNSTKVEGSNINKGKLTLKSLKIKGQNGFDYLPKYKFTYDLNPAFTQINKGTTLNPEYATRTDDWGYYLEFNSEEDNTQFYNISNKDRYSKDKAHAWSLTQIELPEGAKYKIEYESDAYLGEASNDFETQYAIKSIRLAAANESMEDESGRYDLPSEIASKALVIKFENGIDVLKAFSRGKDYKLYLKTLANLNANRTALVYSYNLVQNEVVFDIGSVFTSSDANLNSTKYSYALGEAYPLSGGGIRVKQVTIQDENGNQYYTKYKYENGVTSFAPGNVEKKEIYYPAEIPSPGVLYAKVTEDKYGADNRLNSSTEYEFETMNNHGYGLKYGNQLYLEEKPLAISSPYTFQDNQSNFVTLYNRIGVIHNFTASIGRPLSVRAKNSLGHLISEKTFEYYDPKDLVGGVMQQSFHEKKRYTFDDGQTITDKRYHTYSSKIFYPNVVKSVKEKTSLQEVETIYGNKNLPNNGFDFNTGSPLEVTVIKSPSSPNNSKAYRSKSKQAYTQYPAMASKAINFDNTNMLTANLATYQYVINEDGTENLLSASVQTYNDSWQNRTLNAVKTEYISVNNSKNLSKPDATYTWNSLINEDGTLITSGNDAFVDFNFSGSNDSHWQKSLEITKYDNNSNALESKDINNLFTCSKVNSTNQVIVSSGNATYFEFAYSGAEDQIEGSSFLECEVRTEGSRVTGTSHTGLYSIASDQGQNAFVYQQSLTNGNDIIKPGKYIASVWVRTKSSSNILPTGATLAYQLLNGGSTVSNASVSINSTGNYIKAGEWFLITLNIEIPENVTADQIKVSAFPGLATTLYFDDFRFQPLTSLLKATVYDPITNQVSATLDENNLGTKYIYDGAGRLIEIHQEFEDKGGIGGFIKVKENGYNYARPLSE